MGLQVALVYDEDVETHLLLSPLIFECNYLMVVVQTPEELQEFVVSGRAVCVFDGSCTDAATVALMGCERSLPIVWLVKGRSDLAAPPGFLRVTAELTVADVQKALLIAKGPGKRISTGSVEKPTSMCQPRSNDSTTGDSISSIALLQQASNEEDGRDDPTGRHEYIRACAALGLVPSTRLLQNATATTFSLRYAGLDSLHAASLGAWLAHNSTLQSLDISHNRLEAEGVSAIVDALEGNRVCCSLNLRGNGAGDAQGLPPKKLLEVKGRWVTFMRVLSMMLFCVVAVGVSGGGGSGGGGGDGGGGSGSGSGSGGGGGGGDATHPIPIPLLCFHSVIPIRRCCALDPGSPPSIWRRTGSVTKASRSW